MLQDKNDQGELESLIARTALKYDLMPYESHPIPQSHPGRIGAVAKLFGLGPAPLATARVLELGCAAGGNLIPLASRNPGATFVGVDLSRAQVSAGCARIERLGLRNIEIHCQSLTGIREDLGAFDYIICHGVYSWVPEAVREDILRISRENLAPTGVAYVSYNVLPGWRMMQTLRDMFLLEIPDGEDARRRVAKVRDLLACLKDTVSADGAYKQAVTEAARRFDGMSDDYVTHEFLEEFNEPCTLKAFLGRTRRRGLAYLGDAELPSMILDNHSADTARRIRERTGNNLVATEQYLDFITGRTFRQSLLVHADRAVRINRNLDPSRIDGMHFFTGAGLKVEREGERSILSDAKGRKLTTGSPIVAEALQILAARFPASFTVDDLVDRLSPPGRTREGRILVLSAVFNLVRIGLAQASLEPVGAQPGVSERPAACPLVRSDAACGARATANLRHEKIVLDPVARAVLRELDGTRDRAALAEALTAEVLAGRLKVSLADRPVLDGDMVSRAAAERVPKVIERCAHASLLVG
ncbi:MAG TPA: class I SAM-dependent methyltransferase [Holophaga sp.]|nr:class I SAM-dependent methyltransferase [Holophaga sp.]